MAMKEKAKTVLHWAYPLYPMSAGPVTMIGRRYHLPQ